MEPESTELPGAISGMPEVSSESSEAISSGSAATSDQPTRLLNRNFVILLQAQTVSRIGSQITNIALALWIKDVTGSAAIMGLVQMLGSLPSVVLAPISGVVADRYSRKKILVFSDLFRGIDVLIFTALLFFRPQATGFLLVGLLTLVVVNTIINTFFASAITAVVPDMVPEDNVPSANTLSQLSLQLTIFLGQGLGGVIYRLIGAVGVFLTNSISFFYAAASEALVTIPQKIPEKPRTRQEQYAAFKNDLAQGFIYVWQNSGLRIALIIFSVSTFFAVPVLLLLPFYVESTLHASDDWYGFIIAAFTVGELVGYLGGGIFRLSGRVQSQLILIFLLGQSLGYILLGMVTNSYVALGLSALGGAMGGYTGLVLTSILQVTTPANMRGRVMSLLSALSGALVPIAMGLSGVIADLINQNIPLMYIGCGVASVIIVIFAVLNSEFRNFLAYEFRRQSPT